MLGAQQRIQIFVPVFCIGETVFTLLEKDRLAEIDARETREVRILCLLADWNG